MAEPLGHYQEQRVGVFVDTQNLYHSARDYYERNVNFESLLRFAVGGRRLVRATAYVVEKEGDTSAWPFIYKLSTIGYKVRRMYLTVKETGEGGRPIYSGNWDMGIAADMVRLMPYLDVVVLGSGDGDFVEILEEGSVVYRSAVDPRGPDGAGHPGGGDRLPGDHGPAAH